MEVHIFIHRNTAEFNTAITKNTANIIINIPVLMQPTLMHYELCFLCITHACPYDRQSSHTTFTATATSYIWVIEKSDLHVETMSPCEGHTSRPFFL